MAMSNEDLLKELSGKPIMEVVELVKMLEEQWGVSAAAPVAVAASRSYPLAALRHAVKYHVARLLELDARAGFFKLLLERFGIVFGCSFLDRRRRALDGIFCFLQAQPGDRAYCLNDRNFVFAKAV